MELSFIKVLKLFPKNSKEGFVFGAGIGMISLFIATNFNTESHLLAHKISGLLSLTYLCSSITLFTFNHISRNLNVPYKSFSFYYLVTFIGFLSSIIYYCLSLTMLKLEDEITSYFTKWIDRFFGSENGESYFLGFMFCYAIICFVLAGFLKIIHEALYKIKSRCEFKSKEENNLASNLK